MNGVTDRPWLLATAIAILLSAGMPSAAFAAPLPGPVVINDGAEFTNDQDVSVSLPFPTDGSGLVRLSNDGSSWSIAQSWQPTIDWDVSDPSTGGTSDDGEKTVFVEYDDGSAAWNLAASDSIILDRTPFVGGFCGGSTSGWVIHPCWNAVDPEFGIAAAEFKLDDGPWTSIDSVGIPGIDTRAGYLGGSWATADRQLCYRTTDPAGNVGEPICHPFGLYIPEVTFPGTANESWDVRFEFPRAPITGELFTIRPIFPANFPYSALSDAALCMWDLRWGDKDNINLAPNENFGAVRFDKLFKNGGCDEWTFTLPYTPGLHYQFTFQIRDGWAGDWFFHTSRNGNWDGTMFKATEGTQQRGMPHSTHGIAYVLPDEYVTQPGDPVTYRLRYSTGAPDDITTPKKAWWWASNNECGSNLGSDSATTSLTFTYTPNCQGPWWTGWTWENSRTREILRAEFDPPADKAPPVVTKPAAVPVAGTQLGTAVPTRIGWQSTDPTVRKVRTGVVSNQLQVSRNGGTWKNVTLASATSTSALVNLLPSGTYRYRVRASDRAGNRSAWSIGPVLHVRLLQQAKATLTSSWSTVSNSALSAGSALTSTASRATATLTFSGRAVSWIGSVGPTSGLAQIYVDGALAHTVDLAASSASHRRLLFTRTWSAVGTHTLRVVVLRTFNRPTVSVDAFAVIN